MPKLHIRDTAKNITIDDAFYRWLRDIYDPCILEWDDEVEAETLDSADYDWGLTRYVEQETFKELYATASDAHRSMVDAALEGEEFGEHARIGIATLNRLGYK